MTTSDGTDHSDGGLLEREAEALVEIFNDAAADYSPRLEWFGMGLDHETDTEQFVLEAEEYIDTDGLAALRDHGRIVRYIEAYEFDDKATVQIEIPVRDDVPGESATTDSRTGDQ